jgi:AraC family transcriptional regulator, ethanolamine operon transcriptional activator
VRESSRPISRNKAPAKLVDRASRTVSYSVVLTNEIDELIHQANGRLLEILQIDPGPFEAESFQSRICGTSLSVFGSRRALAQYGHLPADMITFAFATTEPPALWQGRSFGLNDLLLGGPNAEIDVVSPAGFGWASMSVPRGAVKIAAVGRVIESIAEPTSSAVARVERGRADELRKTFNGLVRGMMTRRLDSNAAAWAMRQQEELLRTLLLCALDDAHEIQPIGVDQRSHVVRTVLAAVKHHPDEVPSLQELGRIAGASERALHYAFVQRYGLPPARFIKVYRLNRVRAELKQLDPLKARIADVANKWGFWHMGMFAKDYRYWFGELPSEAGRTHGTFAA